MKEILLMASLILAVVPASADHHEKMQDHIQMHEKMAKAHQGAADCLKAGKPMDECKKSFDSMCKDADGSGKCMMMGGMDHMNMMDKKSPKKSK